MPASKRRRRGGSRRRVSRQPWGAIPRSQDQTTASLWRSCLQALLDAQDQFVTFGAGLQLREPRDIALDLREVDLPFASSCLSVVVRVRGAELSETCRHLTPIREHQGKHRENRDECNRGEQASCECDVDQVEHKENRPDYNAGEPRANHQKSHHSLFSDARVTVESSAMSALV